ncbi:Titin [Lucilia cuprina]|nr:Titin [Lucilia cuprina]
MWSSGAPQPLEVMHDSITLFWKAPEDDGKSDILEYILEYKDLLIREYVFRSIAVNEVGPSPPSPLSPPIRLVAEVKEGKTYGTRTFARHYHRTRQRNIVLRLRRLPEPKVIWKKNGKTMPLRESCGQYTIEKTTVDDEAEYTCVAENEVGSVETTCRVTLQREAHHAN